MVDALLAELESVGTDGDAQDIRAGVGELGESETFNRPLETHCEAQRKDRVVLGPAEVVGDERRQALCAKVEANGMSGRTTPSERGHVQLGAILLLLLIRQPILCLRDLESALAEQSDEADAQVGTSEIECKEFSLLVACRVLFLSALDTGHVGYLRQRQRSGLGTMSMRQRLAPHSLIGTVWPSCLRPRSRVSSNAWTIMRMRWGVTRPSAAGDRTRGAAAYR